MQNIVTLGEINDALKIAAVTAAQLADMGFAALANKPICEGLPPEESRRLRNAKLYPAESIGQIRVALAKRLATPAAAQTGQTTGSVSNATCQPAQIDVQESDNKTPQVASDERKDLVPGVMRCAKCEFQLVRQVLAVNLGEVFAGDSKTEPCPNGCGPLWPVTWKQYAEQAMDAAETMADRAFAAEKEVKQLRGEGIAPQAAPAAVAATASPTFMTADQGRDWAWNNVREYVGTEGWTVMDSVNFHGFFLHGWNYRGQYELQRTATRTAVMQEILSAAPAAVAVPDDRAAFERELIDNHHYVPSDFSFKDGFYGGDDDYIQFGWDVWKARAALAATPANCDSLEQLSENNGLAAVVLPEADFWVRPGATIHPDRGWQCWSNDGTATGAFHADTVRALLAGVSAPAAQPERKYICPVRTIADLVNNLMLMDQALPIYGAQYIEHPPGKRRAIAVPPTVSIERVKDSRWIGEGEALNTAIVWTRAEQPAAPQAQAGALAAEITWPKARDVGRFDDMSPGDSIRVGLDSDNDVYVSVCGGGRVGSVEFCNPGGGGGGKSSRTRLALLALMVAMEADNADDPARDWWARRNTMAAQQGGDKQ